jgi:hypothetical protein
MDHDHYSLHQNADESIFRVRGLGLVEVWFSIIERQAIHSSSLTSVKRPQGHGERQTL